MRDFRSELDDVPGIGARRRRQLLTAFGSVAGVRRASRAELAVGRRREGGRRRTATFRGQLGAWGLRLAVPFELLELLEPLEPFEVLEP